MVKIAPQVRSWFRNRRKAILPLSPGKVALAGAAGSITATTTRASIQSKFRRPVLRTLPAGLFMVFSSFACASRQWSEQLR
jgi:hypothetical protein